MLNFGLIDIIPLSHWKRKEKMKMGTPFIITAIITSQYEREREREREREVSGFPF